MNKKIPLVPLSWWGLKASNKIKQADKQAARLKFSTKSRRNKDFDRSRLDPIETTKHKNYLSINADRGSKSKLDN